SRGHHKRHSLAIHFHDGNENKGLREGRDRITSIQRPRNFLVRHRLTKLKRRRGGSEAANPQCVEERADKRDDSIKQRVSPIGRCPLGPPLPSQPRPSNHKAHSYNAQQDEQNCPRIFEQEFLVSFHKDRRLTSNRHSQNSLSTLS